MSRRLLFLLALVVASLIMAGCSYTPARVETRPLIEVENDRGHRHHRGDDRRYQERHYRGPRDRRGGDFCPPGLRMQGRC